MKHLFCPEGRTAIVRAMEVRPLLAFDFDGTLAPIVARPGDAQIPFGVAQRLRRLQRQLKVAIITGRRVADLVGRLHFEPDHVVGNHGAEDPAGGASDPAAASVMQRLREELAARAGALKQAGVDVEDKGLSFALHYRLARDTEAAVAAIASLGPLLPPDVAAFPGKRVVNLVWTRSPDKAQALAALVEREGARAAVFVGDDLNDEPVFARGEPHWLTVRIGQAPPSQARFFLHSPAEVPAMLDAMLAALEQPQRA